ncbi:MAG: type IV secretion system protein, partial [Selenomonas massiliensis]
LMMNWISLMGALMSGFEVLGFRAGGNNTAIANNIVGEASDTFVQIALKMFTAIWTPNSDSWIPDVVQTIATVMQPGVLLLDIICILVIGGCLFMVALEMFMARIEFYTMALLALPCLAFGTMNKFNFLTEKAIGAMFNLSLKVCVIAFLSAVSKPFIEGFADKIIQADNPAEDLALLFQAVLASLLIFLLVKKIPQLVSGLLSGQPQLSGSDMTGALKGAVAGAAAATGNIAAAQAAAAATGKGGMTGTLTQLGRNYVMSRSPVRSYRDAISAFQRTKDNPGSRILQELRSGVDSRNRQTANAAQPGNDTSS